jgi:hypothetical protein
MLGEKEKEKEKEKDGVSAERKVFMAICIVATIAFAILFVEIYRQNLHIRHQAHLIQQQRYDSVYRTCLDQNIRHDATIATLRRIIDSLPPGPRQTRARNSLSTTVLLINALAPKVPNCQVKASQTTGGQIEPPTAPGQN